MLPQPPLWLVLIAFVCALGPLVFFHELGHYLVARLFGIPAETFSIGFGRELAGWTDRQGTRWKLAWLPLGGYVKFVGDMTPASNPAELESIPEDMREHAFQLRPVWQRFLVVLAGPVANFVLAILIFAALFAIVGKPHSPNVIESVRAGTPAEHAQLKAGDRIDAVAGQSVSSFEEIQRIVSLRPGEALTLTINRSGHELSVPVRLGVQTEHDRFGEVYRVGMLGIMQTHIVTERVPPLELLPVATGYTIDIVRTMVVGISQIVTGRRGTEDVGGPIKIAQIAGQQASLGALPFVQLLALFSINLGFINLLPVPMLDGGHLFFYAVEAIRRRPLSARALEWAFRGGLAVILALVLFTTINDLGSLGLWDRLQRLIG
ncbi:M50 family metallopeptidase [Sphingomonas agri]|uniref:M50 family metallopeptidase n=1 Tax=Sphingomonas agri TaxID=1813878 RepID=UPI00311D8F00